MPESIQLLLATLSGLAFFYFTKWLDHKTGEARLGSYLLWCFVIILSAGILLGWWN
jgi:hypothetical protein